MKNIIFETKEEYLKFRKDWATYFNTQARHLDRGMYGNKVRKLTASHFVLYALIRGKDWKDCCKSCSEETMNKITSDLKSNWFYSSKIFKEVFNFSDGQIELIKQVTVCFPHTERRVKNLIEERVQLTEEEMQSCYA